MDEFCEVKLGKSYKRLQAIAANRNLIGQEAFEQAEKLGLRQVDYNAIKALPAPDQELIRRAVEEAKSRDEVLDVLQELAARNAKAREKLEADVAQLKVDNEYEAEQRKKLQAKTEQLEKQLRKGGPQVQPYSERLAEFRTGVGELQDVAGKSLVQMAKQIDALAQWWQQEVLAAPDYDPQAPVRMPPELLDTARALAEHIELLAGGVGALQHKVAQAFGAELEMQPQYLMRDPMGGQMGDAEQDGDGVDEGEAAYADASA
ncbi:hypothetical protein CK623_02815 [Vandammella animalimorsus]|uniref:Uncharacterized protein n=1 Tax=Vandammella animalimorsus TaxID=2029117 RepID=A0A2A2AU57_9BURK|nr:hypothetical protein [Vandammella animalimorsus]PAT41189.1 hypothetical protein CK623_02815 [Vandammella animalimorsus]